LPSTDELAAKLSGQDEQICRGHPPRSFSCQAQEE